MWWLVVSGFCVLCTCCVCVVRKNTEKYKIISIEHKCGKVDVECMIVTGPANTVLTFEHNIDTFF